MQGNAQLPKKILIVDDDFSVAQSLENPLKGYNVEVVKATTPEEALAAFDQETFEVALVELEFGQIPGWSLIQHWREHQDPEKRQTSFIIIAGISRKSEDELMVKELGNIEFIVKPFSLVQVLPFLSRGVARKGRAKAVQDFRKSVMSQVREEDSPDKALDSIREKMNGIGQAGFLMMVEILQSVKRHDEAVDFIDSMLATDPRDTFALGMKADILKEQGQFKNALGIYEQAHALAPGNVKRLQAMADCYLEDGQAEAAVEVMKQMLMTKPFDGNLKFELCDRLEKAGYLEEALGLMKATTTPREVLRHYNNRGVALSKKGQVKEAIAEYKKALKVYPTYKENYRIMFNIALAYTTFKNAESYTQAESYLAKCVKLAPDFDKAAKMLATVRKALAGRKAS